MEDLDPHVLLGLEPAPGTRCECGAVHALGTRQILLGQGALEHSDALLRARHGSGAVVFALSDERTEAAAGARWKRGLAGVRLAERVLPATPRPVPTEELVADLVAAVRAAGAVLLVGIGGGVVSDLVKRVSLEAGVPSWSVATAASVDGYTSGTAAIRAGGYHRAVPARASEVVVCDLEVIAAEPRELFVAGQGDLLAKFAAFLDWEVAGRVAGEWHCERLAQAALDAARNALDAAPLRERDPLGAAAALARAGLVSGLAMQAAGSSRPAASAEHTVAHFWEAEDALADEALALHGVAVGAASHLLLPGYVALWSRLREAGPGPGARAAAQAPEPSWEEALESPLERWRARIAQERQRRRVDPGARLRQLEALERERATLVALALPLLREWAQVMRELEELGFPLGLDQLGIPPALRLLPVRNVHLLRDRYTSFDLARVAGLEDVVQGAVAAALDGQQTRPGSA